MKIGLSTVGIMVLGIALLPATMPAQSQHATHNSAAQSTAGAPPNAATANTGTNVGDTGAGVNAGTNGVGANAGVNGTGTNAGVQPNGNGPNRAATQPVGTDNYGGGGSGWGLWGLVGLLGLFGLGGRGRRSESVPRQDTTTGPGMRRVG